MRSLYSITLAALSLVLCSCATIFTGTKQNVTINSTPTGATILVDGLPVGKTPATVSITKPGFGERTVTLRLAGHADTTFTLQKGFNGVCILSVLLGILPLAVDLATGAFMNFDPSSYQIELEGKRAQISDNMHVEKVVFTHELQKDGEGNLIVPNAAQDNRIAVVDLEKQHVAIFE